MAVGTRTPLFDPCRRWRLGEPLLNFTARNGLQSCHMCYSSFHANKYNKPVRDSCGHILCRSCFFSSNKFPCKLCSSGIENIKECPQCKISFNGTDCRPAQDSCGDIKCRSCLISDKDGCSQCKDLKETQRLCGISSEDIDDAPPVLSLKLVESPTICSSIPPPSNDDPNEHDFKSSQWNDTAGIDTDDTSTEAWPNLTKSPSAIRVTTRSISNSKSNNPLSLSRPSATISKAKKKPFATSTLSKLKRLKPISVRNSPGLQSDIAPKKKQDLSSTSVVPANITSPSKAEIVENVGPNILGGNVKNLISASSVSKVNVCYGNIDLPTSQQTEIGYSGIGASPEPIFAIKSAAKHCDDQIEPKETKPKKRNRVTIPDHITVVPGHTVMFHCKFCQKKFKTKGHIKYHDYCQDGKYKTKPFQCEECGQKFIAKSHYEYHLRTHTGERPYVCEKCGKGFNQKGKVTRHMKSHTGEKHFKCTECGRGFSNGEALKIHHLTHTGERPYACKFCNKRFRGNTSLKKHMLTHTGEERPYVCTHCGKSYGLKWTLDLHLRTHSTERPYPCDQCSRTFSNSSDLRRHLVIHSGPPPLKCWICGTAFRQKYNLDRHIKNLHKDPKETAKMLANEAANEYLAIQKYPVIVKGTESTSTSWIKS